MPNPIEFDRAAILRLADLARLHLPAERLPLLRQRLQRLVEAFGALAELPPEALEPPPVAAAPLPLRVDAPEPPMTPAQALANAPRTAGGAFLVPRVVDA